MGNGTHGLTDRWVCEKSRMVNFFFFLLFFLGLYPWHIEVPRLEVDYTAATAMRDLSHVCNLHHSSQEHRILNTLRGAKDRTHILMDSSWAR